MPVPLRDWLFQTDGPPVQQKFSCLLGEKAYWDDRKTIRRWQEDDKTSQSLNCNVRVDENNHHGRNQS